MIPSFHGVLLSSLAFIRSLEGGFPNKMAANVSLVSSPLLSALSSFLFSCDSTASLSGTSKMCFLFEPL